MGGLACRPAWTIRRDRYKTFASFLIVGIMVY